MTVDRKAEEDTVPKYLFRYRAFHDPERLGAQDSNEQRWYSGSRLKF